MNTINCHVARPSGDALRRWTVAVLATACMLITAVVERTRRGGEALRATCGGRGFIRRGEVASNGTCQLFGCAAHFGQHRGHGPGDG